jgi:hypothetical protein
VEGGSQRVARREPVGTGQSSEGSTSPVAERTPEREPLTEQTTERTPAVGARGARPGTLAPGAPVPPGEAGAGHASEAGDGSYGCRLHPNRAWPPGRHRAWPPHTRPGRSSRQCRRRRREAKQVGRPGLGPTARTRGAPIAPQSGRGMAIGEMARTYAPFASHTGHPVGIVESVFVKACQRGSPPSGSRRKTASPSPRPASDPPSRPSTPHRWFRVRWGGQIRSSCFLRYIAFHVLTMIIVPEGCV